MSTNRASLLLGAISEDQHIYLDSLHRVMGKLSTEEYLQKIDSYLLRHQVKPGLTGWAQVNGARGEMPDIQHMQTRLNYDLYYIHRWSFWLDLQIILQTIVNLFKGDVHAY